MPTEEQFAWWGLILATIYVTAALIHVGIGVLVDLHKRETNQQINRPGSLGNTPWPQKEDDSDAPPG